MTECERCGAGRAAICAHCHEKRADESVMAARRQIARVVKREIEQAVRVRIMRVETMDGIMAAVERAVKGGGPE